MRFYSKKRFQHIRFDKAEYCQFLREQGLTEQQITSLVIRLTEWQANDPHAEDVPDDKVQLGSFIDTRTLLECKGSLGPKILLHPEQHEIKHYSLNDTLLEETRHYMQSCMGMFPMLGIGAYENRPEEIDAKEFVKLHQSSVFVRED